MKLRLSLQGRILLGLAILAVVLLSVLWILVRPKYETSVVSERITIVQQLQSYVIENLDKQISEWVSASRSIAWEIAEHPRDGESLLRSTISLFPEIVQIKIQSPELPDELTSQNTAYPVPAVQPAEHQFIPSADSIVQLAWLTAVPGTPSTMMVMRTRFQVSGRMFMMSVIWDAKSLQHYIERLPLGTDYYLRIYSKSFVVFENRPEKAFTDSVHTQQHMNDLRKVKSAGGEWRVITGTFRSTDLTMLVAVPEGAILEPVHQLLVYSSTFIVGFLLVLLLLGNGKGTEGFREENERTGMDGHLAGLCPEDIPLDAHNIADIHQPEGIIHSTEVVLPEIHLDPPVRVLDMAERRLPHSSQRHDPARDRNLARRRVVGKRCNDLAGKVIAPEPVRVRVDPERTQLFELGPAPHHQFVQFLGVRSFFHALLP